MSKLSNYIKNIREAEEQAPEEELNLDNEGGEQDKESGSDEENKKDKKPKEKTKQEPVDGTDEVNTDEENEENEENEEGTEKSEENDDTELDLGDLDDEKSDDEEEFDKEIDQTQEIEKMIGMTEIQHTSSSTIIDFEDGGQAMYVHPIISVKSETMEKIIQSIVDDVKQSYANSTDEITGKKLKDTRYWESINTLVKTMVRSQLTKSSNIDGLLDEIKSIFKVLEVK